jgi:hypothetical protein
MLRRTSDLAGCSEYDKEYCDSIKDVEFLEFPDKVNDY